MKEMILTCALLLSAYSCQGQVTGKSEAQEPAKSSGQRVEKRYRYDAATNSYQAFELTIDESEVSGTDDQAMPFEGHEPEFPGGEAALMEYIQKQLRYPEEAEKAGVKGKVLVMFTIDEQGNSLNPQIWLTPSLLLVDEALRIVRSFPRWQPATDSKGNPVPIKYCVPINFVLGEDK